MKIFLTGATGFVGQNLLPFLSSNCTAVESLSTGDLSLDKERLTELFNINESSSILHLAGKAHDLKNVSKPDDYYYVNFELTKKIYNAFLESASSKFIFISSVKAVADKVSYILTEEVMPHPLTHYGKSKLMAEQFIISQPLPKGKMYYILRPCMIHGPANKGNLNLLNNFVAKGIPYPLASYFNQRSFLSVENLCFVIKEILERDDIPSGVYNLADDDPLSTIEVLSLLSEAYGRSVPLLHVPQRLISLIAKVGDKLHLPLTTERLQKLTENYVVSNAKIKSVLKKELPLSAREGILRTARSFNNG
jgi:nucleoside-diphosphate-sugar epimerase